MREKIDSIVIAMILLCFLFGAWNTLEVMDHERRIFKIENR